MNKLCPLNLSDLLVSTQNAWCIILDDKERHYKPLTVMEWKFDLLIVILSFYNELVNFDENSNNDAALYSFFRKKTMT